METGREKNKKERHVKHVAKVYGRMTVKAGRAIKRKHDILSHVIGALLVSHPTDINWACTLHFTCLPGLPHEKKGKKGGIFHLVESLLSRILRLLPKAGHGLWLL